MAKIKVKPPKETRAQLVELVLNGLEQKYRDPRQAMEFLLNFFTSADLVGINEELKR